MTLDPRNRAALDAIGELLPPEALEVLHLRLMDACSKPGEAWVLAEFRCKDKRVQHADVTMRQRIAAR